MQFEGDGAVLRKIRIVIEPDDFQRRRLEDKVLQFVVRQFAESLKRRYLNGGDAAHRHRVLVDLTEINRLAESEIVRVKKTPGATREIARAENVEQRRFDVAAKKPRRDADQHVDLERHENRRAHFEVVSGEAEALEKTPHLLGEGAVDRAPTFAIDRDERSPPTAKPAELRRRLLHLWMPACHLRVIVLGASPFLGAKG